MIDPARIAAAMAHLTAEHDATMVANMIAAADTVPFVAPTSWADYWQEAIGGSYRPVKWNPRHADHPIRVKDALARLKAGEACPEAADIIVGILHGAIVAQNIQQALGEIVEELSTANEELRRQLVGKSNPP